MAERIRVVLICERCNARNYRTTKSRQASDKKLTLKKFCPNCGCHTQHYESK